MMFSSRLPLSALVPLCRSLRHYLSSGLTVHEAFAHLARKGPFAARGVCTRVLASLQRGDDLSAALKKEQAAFPPLVVAMVSVGEHSGMLAEIFGHLEDHFVRQQQLWNAFVSKITWPVVQLILAVFVIAGLIYFLGIIADMRGPGAPPYDPLGLGLSGASGAMIFLGVVVGIALGLCLLYFLLTRGLGGRASVSAFLLRLPAIGPCLQSLALARFCTAMRLTHETGMPVGKALQLSLRATGNPAWEAQASAVKAATMTGDDLTTILSRTGLFPDEFEQILSVAEMSGSISEVMEKQAEHYHEEAGRRLSTLTAVAGYAIWAGIAILIIIAIFRLYGSYFDQISNFKF
jgi:type IV pilus assembly protein PilC